MMTEGYKQGLLPRDLASGGYVQAIHHLAFAIGAIITFGIIFQAAL